MLFSPDALFALTLALAFDAVIGDPDVLWRRLPHPVVWFGAAIARADRTLNRENETFMRQRAKGVIALAAILVLFGSSAWALKHILTAVSANWFIEAVIASSLLAQRSLHDHVAAVARGLEIDGLDGARHAVSMIVGRDPKTLDEAGIARAAIESAAENFSDGIVAPAFWFACAGLPGLVLYKVINTADSMIGHMSDRHRAFGWAAARLDDAANLVPARLSGALIALASPIAGGSVLSSFHVMHRDARLHRSPNAGWPEAAMAGALGLALAGPRRYGVRFVDDQFLNAEGRRDAHANDIRLGLRVMIGACGFLFILVAGAALISF